jgi:cell division septation protein DedD
MAFQNSIIFRVTTVSILCSGLAACGRDHHKIEFRYSDRVEANAREAEAAEEEVARFRQAQRLAGTGKTVDAGYGVDVKPVLKVDDARIEKVIAAAEKVVSEAERVTAGKASQAKLNQAVKVAKAQPEHGWEAAAETKPAAAKPSDTLLGAKSAAKRDAKPVAKAEPKPVAKTDVSKSEPAKHEARKPEAAKTATQAATSKPALAPVAGHAPASVDTTGSVFVVQLGAFREKDNAERFHARMKGEGVPAVLKSMNHSKNGEIYVVRLEPTANRDEAEKNLKRLHDEKHLDTQMIVLPADAH